MIWCACPRGWAALAVLEAVGLAAGWSFVLRSEGFVSLATSPSASRSNRWRLRHAMTALVRDQ
jgi:hypothetical protein